MVAAPAPTMIPPTSPVPGYLDMVYGGLGPTCLGVSWAFFTVATILMGLRYYVKFGMERPGKWSLIWLTAAYVSEYLTHQELRANDQTDRGCHCANMRDGRLQDVWYRQSHRGCRDGRNGRTSCSLGLVDTLLRSVLYRAGQGGRSISAHLDSGQDLSCREDVPLGSCHY